MTLQTLIKKKLLQTRKCKFKANWIPKGWTCVEIDTFAEALTEEIRKVMYVALREPNGQGR